MAASDTALPLALLPGMPCDDTLWTHQVGHIGCDRPLAVPDLACEDSLDAMAALPMGGRAASAMLHAAPQRIARLALLDTLARADTAEQRVRRRMLLDLVRHAQFKGGTPRRLPPCLHPDRVTKEPLALSKEIAAGIPGARLAVIEECGHRSPLERPQAGTALLRLWLEGALP
ncbi:alpha/beta fold hydrolase [Elioraea sp.]|uniref:alpha/beta fold hydrolase n=1 Tax=Elioraea sp. TaxID=2185103 RepID=UPI003F730019